MLRCFWPFSKRNPAEAISLLPGGNGEPDAGSSLIGRRINGHAGLRVSNTGFRVFCAKRFSVNQKTLNY